MRRWREEGEYRTAGTARCRHDRLHRSRSHRPRRDVAGPHDPYVAVEALATLADAGVPLLPAILLDEADAVIRHAPSTHTDHVSFIERFTRRADLADVVAGEDVVSFVLCGLPDKASSEVAAGVAHLGAATVSVDHQYGGTA